MQNIKSKQFFFVVTLFCIQLCWVTSLVYSQATDTSGTAVDMQNLFEKLHADTSESATTVGAGVSKTDSLLLSVLRGESADYNQFGIMHLKRSLSWQFYSSIVIFWMVVFIVAFGLYLSFKQFKLSEKVLSQGMKAEEQQSVSRAIADANSLTQANLELTGSSIKINSAVIGLVILALSLGFFFLYLKYVYKIEVLDPFKINMG